jgi:hypothetical protein
MTMSRLERVVNLLLVVAILSGCLVILQKSLHFVQTGPVLNIDDSIPNVAVALAEHGRYGFLSSPTQGFNEVDRTYAFFNYGPLYFYVAAAATWFFGPSVSLYRMLHPAGLVAIILLLAWMFRRISLVAPAVVALVLFDLYLRSHWPIGRPDIMVSICVALMLACAWHAIEHRRGIGWFGVGFFAMSALTTHQIALAMAPAAGVIWLWDAATEGRSSAPGQFWRRASIEIGAMLAGGAAAAIIYLVAIDFRLRELWTLLSAGAQSRHRPFVEAITSHFQYAWSSLDPRTFYLVLAGFCAAVVTAVAAVFAGESRRTILALVMPPVVVATLYQVSLGFYGSNHTGYVILSQVATLWAVGAVLAAALVVARTRLGAGGRALDVAVVLLFTVAVAQADARWLRTPGLWESRAAGDANIGDYIREVTAPFPERASVWGSLYFGVDAGDRTDLVQFYQNFKLIQDFKPEQRSALAPDFLALSAYELDMTSVMYLGGEDLGLEKFTTFFPNVRYRPVRFVSAPPYGTTRDYERVPLDTPREGDPVPDVAINDGTGRQWSSRLGPPLDVKFTETAPVSFDAEIYSIRPKVHAQSSLVADVPEGSYLVEVALDRAAAANLGFVFATSSRHLFWRGGWTDFSMPATPYWPGDTRAWLLVDHPGGLMYLSRFESAAPVEKDAETPEDRRIPIADAQHNRMRVVSMRAVDVLQDHTGRLAPVGVPALTSWSRISNALTVTQANAGGVRITGTAPAEQWILQSPNIAVPQHQRMMLTLPIDLASGSLKAAVLGGGGMLTPETVMPRRIAFDTGAAAAVQIIVVNGPTGRDEPLDAVLGAPALTPTIPKVLYVDSLMACRSAYRPRPADCIHR